MCVYVYRVHYEPIGPQPYPVIYVVIRLICGLLNRKMSEERRQVSNDHKTKNRTKTTKRKKVKIKVNYQKWMIDGAQKRAESPQRKCVHGENKNARNTTRGTRKIRLRIAPAARYPMPNADRNYPRIRSQRYNIYNTVISGFSDFLFGTADAASGVLGSSNQLDSETSQVSYGHPIFNLNLVHLFCLLFHLGVWTHFPISHPRGRKPETPFA